MARYPMSFDGSKGENIRDKLCENGPILYTSCCCYCNFLNASSHDLSTLEKSRKTEKSKTQISYFSLRS